MDSTVELGGETIFGTGDTGVCVLDDLPAVAYRVRLHSRVDNDHYDPVPIKEIRVDLAPDGTIVRVVISTP